MGTEPDCKDKFIMYAYGLVIIVAASFNIPGGRLSRPGRFIYFKISQLSEDFIIGDWTKNKIFRWCDFTRINRLTPLQSGKLLVFKTPAIVENKSQKPWPMEDVFDVLVPFIFIATAELVEFLLGTTSWLLSKIYLGKGLCLAIDLYSNCSYIFSLGYSLCCVVVCKMTSQSHDLSYEPF